MAITAYGGFDGVAITEPQFGVSISDWAAELGVTGAGDWKVTAGSNPGQLNISAGQGWAHGVTVVSDAIASVTQSSLPSGTGATRWDLVAMRRDWQPPGGTATFVIVQGSSSKQLPAAATAAGGTGMQVFPGVVHDQPLALVQWTSGQTQPTTIVDLRVWASNGGLVAKDELALTFISRIGSTITINGSDWKCVLGTNDIPQWTTIDYAGGVSLFGASGQHVGAGVPNGGVDFLMQAGSTVVKPDTNGYATIWLPKAFPNSLIDVIPTNADNSATGRGYSVSLGSAGPGLDNFKINISNGAGVGYGSSDGSKLARIGWIAIGR